MLIITSHKTFGRVPCFETKGAVGSHVFRYCQVIHPCLAVEPLGLWVSDLLLGSSNQTRYCGERSSFATALVAPTVCEEAQHQRNPQVRPWAKQGPVQPFAGCAHPSNHFPYCCLPAAAAFAPPSTVSLLWAPLEPELASTALKMSHRHIQR